MDHARQEGREPSVDRPPASVAAQEPMTGGIIEIHLRELNQLFDSLDPSPFHERDLDRRAEEYIVETVREARLKIPRSLVVYVDRFEPTAGEADEAAEAIRLYFARRARLLHHELRALIHRGLISLIIGLACLTATFVAGQIIMRVMQQSNLANLLRESLLIGGWVAMWRPLEIFLYDWWPILGNQRLHDRLSRIDVQIVFGIRSRG